MTKHRIFPNFAQYNTPNFHITTPNNPDMDEISIYQTALFEAIAAKFNNKQAELDFYRQFFTLHRSAIYDRKSGNTTISFDEGVQLILSQQVAPAPLLDFFAQTIHPAPPNFPSTPQAAPVEYLTLLNRDLQALCGGSKHHIWHKITDLPIIWIKSSRILAAFKLYHWFKVIAWTKEEHCPPFTREWIEREDITQMLDLGREILDAYWQIPSTEIWSLHMFDSTLAQIESVQQTGGLEATNMLLDLREGIQTVLLRMRQITQKSQKNNPENPVAVQVFENRISLSGGLLLGRSESRGFCYFDIGYPDYMRYQDANIVANQINRLQNSLSQMISLSGNEKACFHFFNTLEARISRKWTIISKITQPA